MECPLPPYHNYKQIKRHILDNRCAECFAKHAETLSIFYREYAFSAIHHKWTDKLKILVDLKYDFNECPCGIEYLANLYETARLEKDDVAALLYNYIDLDRGMLRTKYPKFTKYIQHLQDNNATTTIIIY
jgi:hypothetical protein